MISYLPTFVPTKILIIGCGGTGSRLVPLLAQFVKACPWVIDPEMTLVDDDIVEEKNLLRQNFIATDVGKYKAEVLAQRYSRAFNMKIISSKNRVVASANDSLTRRAFGPAITPRGPVVTPEQAEIFAKHSNNAIVILCVDSPEARRDIISNMTQSRAATSNVLVLDSGNENDFGQVSVSTWKRLTPFEYDVDRTIKSWPNSIPGNLQITDIPADLSYFFDMVAADTLSCADLDQTMAINTMMANAMFGIIQNFFYSKPLAFHRLDVTLSNGVTPQWITPRWLDKVSKYIVPYVNIDKTIPYARDTINQNKWAKEGSLVNTPCHQTFYIDREVLAFDTHHWRPFKKLNDAAEHAAKMAAEKLEQGKAAAIRAAIEIEVRAKVKKEMLASVATTIAATADKKDPDKSNKATGDKYSVALAGKKVFAPKEAEWPFVTDLDRASVEISPDVLMSIQNNLREQERIRQQRFNERVAQVQRETQESINSRGANNAHRAFPSQLVEEWVDTENIDDDES